MTLIKKRTLDFLPSVLVAAGCFLLFAFPAAASAGASAGLDLCLRVVVPSLFPFFAAANLLRGGGLFERIGGRMKGLMRFFSLPACCGGVFALGLVSGFPVGAEGSARLFEEGGCSKKQAERLLALSNNPSPAFVISAAGAGILGSAAAGWAMFLCQICSVVVVGKIMAYIYKEESMSFLSRKQTALRPFPQMFTESVADALFSVLKVCAFVIFFIMLTDFPVRMGWIAENGAGKLLFSGFFELTSAFGALGGLSFRTAFALSGIVLGWAGLSVHCQVAVFALKGKLSLRPYLLSRLLQSLFCGGLTFVCSFFFPA